MKPIVVIHGWSDDSSSFETLSHQLRESTGRELTQVWLGDYVSMDNDVKITDVAIAMQRAWQSKDLPTEPNSVDVVIHSTGGLVVRLWMQNFYTEKNKRPPVANLVMLAPANFGSPLAHKGRAIIGRVVKGFRSKKRFQTGTHILKALEMASPFTWQLAMRDRFISRNAFTEGGVACTVIVGNRGYRGIKGVANERGSDGTVYMATANLNCAYLQIDVDAENGEISSGELQESMGDTAFLVLDRFDHGSITGDGGIPDRLLNPILQSLDVKLEDDSFSDWCRECALETQSVMELYENSTQLDQHGYQNTVFRVLDDQQEFVNDYLIEFYGRFDNEEDQWAERFHRDITAKVHAYKDNNGYRSFMVNTTSLYQVMNQVDERLRISMTASPDIEEDKTLAGYNTFDIDAIGYIELDPDQLRQYFKPNRTLLIDFRLPRHQKDEIFKLKNIESQ